MDQHHRQRLQADANNGNKVAERLLLNAWLAEENSGEIKALLVRYATSGEASTGRLLEAELSCFHNWPGDQHWHDLLRECCDSGHREARLVRDIYHEWSALSGTLPQTEKGQDGLWGDGWHSWESPDWTTVAEQDGVKIEHSAAFVPRSLIRFLRAVLGPQLRPSAVIDPQSGKPVAHPIRVNRSAQWLPEHLGWAGKLYEYRLAETCGYDVSHGEVLNLLHYRPDECYKPHLDCIGNKQASSPEGQRQGGQRASTVLLALGDDDFTGGETYFPRLEVGAKAMTGELLRFNNSGASGQALPASLHEGRPVEAGEKWLLSKWVREQPTPYGREISMACPQTD